MAIAVAMGGNTVRRAISNRLGPRKLTPLSFADSHHHLRHQRRQSVLVRVRSWPVPAWSSCKFSLRTRAQELTSRLQWDIYDYVIYAAGQYGLRVILPLTDNYD